MKLHKEFKDFCRSAINVNKYYESLNLSLKRLNGEYTMLHYPLLKNVTDSFLTNQKNLSNHCICLLEPLTGKNVLDIGCGNGLQSIYILNKYQPTSMIGIDINEANIQIAERERARCQLKNIDFRVDNAEQLNTIPSESIDVVINIESAFHYPDKKSFLKNIYRVLKSGGQYLIADLITTKAQSCGIRKYWKNKLRLYHWDLSRYERELELRNLRISRKDDITENVISGFRNYPHYFKHMDKGKFLNDLMTKLFYFINLKLYIHLLQNRRIYQIFVGYKEPSKI